ncbi:MAG: beta-galactosidase, partial [Muribaculaceae bacterium]|nr:beta-galactosidase [Muribaculaceae bacterium]
DVPTCGEGWYRGTFNLKKTADTYLDMSGWGKGLVWVNGECLGRFWNVGPQQTLFLPGCWLRKGVNEVVVMDITGPESAMLQGLDTPVIDTLRLDKMPHDGVSVSYGSGKAEPKPLNEAGNDAAPGAK